MELGWQESLHSRGQFGFQTDLIAGKQILALNRHDPATLFPATAHSKKNAVKKETVVSCGLLVFQERDDRFAASGAGSVIRPAKTSDYLVVRFLDFLFCSCRIS